MATSRKRTWNGPGGVEKSAWVVSYVDPKGKQRQKTYKSKKEADKGKLQIEVELDQGTHVAPRDSATVAWAAEEFVRDCERRAKIGDAMTKTTASNYELRMRLYAVPHLGRIKLVDLTRIQVQQWVNDLAEKHAPTSVRTTAATFKMMLQFSVRSGWLKRNVMRDDPVRLPAVGETRVKVASKTDIVNLLKAASERDHGEKLHSFFNRLVFVTLGMLCGLRKGELCGLQWEDVDFVNGTFTVNHSFSKLDGLKAPKTRAGRRTIDLAPITRAALLQAAKWRLIRDRLPAVTGNVRVAALKRLFAETGDVPIAALSGYVICATNGKPLMPSTAHTELWNPLLKKAGLWKDDGGNLTIHGMRHAAASLWIEQGLRPDLLKRLIGHANISTTHDIYGHLFPEDGSRRKGVEGAASQFDMTQIRHMDLNYGF